MTDEISFPPLLDLSTAELQVGKQHLLAEIRREAPRRRSTFALAPPRLALAGIGATLAIAAAAIVVFATASTGGAKPADAPNPGGLNGPVVFPPTPIALSDASTALGAPIVLPDSSLVPASDAAATVDCEHITGQTDSNCNDQCAQSGPSNDVSCDVWIRFPSQGLRIRYTRVTSSDPLADYQGVVDTNPNAQVVHISGVPALLITATPNDPSSTGSYVRLVVGGTTITILGPSDAGTTESVAKSIIDQANASGS